MMPSRASLSPIELTGSMLATVTRGGQGIAAEPAALRPALLFDLYEFEGCPHCRLVREVLTELDLDAQIYPCPKGGERYRERALALGGKAQFPFLVDPNSGEQLYESADIITYLFERYGRRPVPLRWQLMALQKFNSTLALLPRLGYGMRARRSRPAAQALELYSFESSPFARPVRERLCELELSWVLRSVGRTHRSDWLPPALRERYGVEATPGTVNRKALLHRAGKLTVPYLVDPNSGVEMGESADIVAYLERSYALD